MGEQGAEQLLGKGDMLYMSSANRMVRIHAPFVSDNEIEKINNFLRSQEEPDYIDEILNFVDEKTSMKVPKTKEKKMTGIDLQWKVLNLKVRHQHLSCRENYKLAITVLRE